MSSSLRESKDSKDPNVRRSSLQARKQELVRNAIWDAAIDLFAVKGFDGTTVDDIVEAAGVSRRSFFRYFSSKTDLLTQRGTVRYENLLTEAIQSSPASYSVPEVLRHTVLQVAQKSVAEPRTRKIIEIANKYPSARQALSHVAEVHHPVREAFARRFKKVSKENWTPDLLAGLTLSMVSATIHIWFENPEQSISTAVDQVFASLVGLVCEDSKPNGKNQSVRTAIHHNSRRSRS
ncbi:MAG: TetR family transcriptional regulator [Bryobacteraceae bacterium]